MVRYAEKMTVKSSDCHAALGLDKENRIRQNDAAV